MYVKVFLRFLVEALLAEVVQTGSASQASGGSGSSQKIQDQISVLQSERAIQTSLHQLFERPSTSG
jgi:hypothetical protein